MSCVSALNLLTDSMKLLVVRVLHLLMVMGFVGFPSGLGAQTLSEMLTEWNPAWPQRAGITAVGYSQEQNYALDNFMIDFPVEVDPTLLLSEIENDVSQWGTKADFWILPFLNVHAMVGVVDGQTGVGLTPAAVELIGTDQIAVNYDGTVYAGGTTLAYGQDWWFLSLTGIYAYTDVKGEIESIPSLMIMPKFGVRREALEFWCGATYQRVAERQSGVFDLDGLVLNYDLELEAEEGWNTQLGFRYRFSDNVLLTLEAGFGNRKSMTGHLEWRF